MNQHLNVLSTGLGAIAVRYITILSIFFLLSTHIFLACWCHPYSSCTWSPQTHTHTHTHRHTQTHTSNPDGWLHRSTRVSFMILGSPTSLTRLQQATQAHTALFCSWQSNNYWGCWTSAHHDDAQRTLQHLESKKNVHFVQRFSTWRIQKVQLSTRIFGYINLLTDFDLFATVVVDISSAVP